MARQRPARRMPAARQAPKDKTRGMHTPQANRATEQETRTLQTKRGPTHLVDTPEAVEEAVAVAEVDRRPASTCTRSLTTTEAKVELKVQESQ